MPSIGRLREGGPTYELLLNEKNLATVERLISFAEGKGHTLLELAFAWLLAQPAVVSVIAGATRPEQVVANAASTSWRLDPADMAEVDLILTGKN